MAYELGEGLAEHLSIGKVEAVHPNTFTATVAMIVGNRKGQTTECRLRSLSKNDGSKSGVIFVPEIGDEVYVDWSYGKPPLILDASVQSTNSIEKETDYKTSVLPVRGFGAEDKQLSSTGRRPYRWGPTDLMPGDKLMMGTKGNMLGILAGGLSVLRGGNLSQIILSKLGDWVKIVSRNFELFSDFGVMRMLNREGATSFELLGNASGKKTNAQKDSNWDYIFKLGGKNLFELALMKNRFQFLVNSEGHATLRTAKSFTVEMETPPDIRMRGDSIRRIEGNSADVVDGDATKIYRGTKTERAGKKVGVYSGSYTKVISGSEVRNNMFTRSDNIRGPSAEPVNVTAKEVNIGTGDYNIFIGNPKMAAIPPLILAAMGKMGNYDLKVTSGDISQKILVKGDITMQTTLGDITYRTVAGNASFETLAGNVTVSTKFGNAELSTLGGNVTVSTKLGNVEMTTKAGNVEIGTLAGNVKISSTMTSLELTPAGLKFSNQKGSVELFALLDELVTQLISAQTPGFGGPLSTLPQLVALQLKIKMLMGA